MPRPCSRPCITSPCPRGSWPLGMATTRRPTARPARGCWHSRGCSSRRGRLAMPQPPPTIPKRSGWRSWSGCASNSSAWRARCRPCSNRVLRPPRGRPCARRWRRPRRPSSVCVNHYRRTRMLSEPQRQTIIELHAKGLNLRQISHTLGHSRRTVRRVLAQGAPRPPRNQPRTRPHSPRRCPRSTARPGGTWCGCRSCCGSAMARRFPTAP